MRRSGFTCGSLLSTIAMKRLGARFRWPRRLVDGDIYNRLDWPLWSLFFPPHSILNRVRYAEAAKTQEPVFFRPSEAA